MKSQTGLLYDWIQVGIVSLFLPYLLTICMSLHSSTFSSFAILQVVCAKYGISVESSSQIDRRALNYFISYYLNINIPNFPLKVLPELNCDLMSRFLFFYHFLTCPCFSCLLVRKHYLIVERNCSVVIKQTWLLISPLINSTTLEKCLHNFFR